MISNSNHETHKEELELLQNILFEQILINEDTPNYDFDISIKLDAETPKLNFTLKINLPNEYPNIHPLYEIIENKIQLDNVKYKEMERKSNLKEIKAQRNNVIAERISLSKELETVKVK